jgi:hypothetical protein
MAQHSHDLYVIDDQILRIDWPGVHSWLAPSYWSQGISIERVKRAASNAALVVGPYAGDEQVAYARVVWIKLALPGSATCGSILTTGAGPCTCCAPTCDG